MTQIVLNLSKSGKILGVRHLQVLLIFLCCTLSYFMRINASVAVVAMTNKDTTNPDFEEFDWTLQEISYILSSFFWGYIVMQLPGGWLAERYGTKLLFLLSVLIPAILTMIIPITVHYGGWQAFCAIRIIQGIFQGLIFPSLHAFVAKWAPFHERNRLGAFSHSGVEFGTILAFTASGLIAGSSIGWPGIYYVSGGLGLIWSVLWMLLGANNPYECKYISKEERKYIETSLNTFEGCYKDRPPIPWLRIWTSMPFLALLTARTGQAWGFSTLLSEIPTYMNSIMKMDIKQNAVFSGLPYMVMLLVLYMLIILADVFNRKQWCSLTVMRKTLNSISFCIPGLALIGLGYVTKDQVVVAVAILVIAIGANGGHTLGSVINHIDLSPNHAGILMGITNTVGNIIAIITPLVVGVVVTDKENQVQWRTIFFISSGMWLIANLIFVIFGKMTTQPWDDIRKENSKTQPDLTAAEATSHDIKITTT